MIHVGLGRNEAVGNTGIGGRITLHFEIDLALELTMNITVGEAIEIAIMVVQAVLAWIAIRRQSEPQNPHDASRNEIRRATSFLRCIEPFDAFALVVSVSALFVAALVEPAWLVPWAQRLVPFFFVALASSVFALTVVRVQANRFSKDLTHTLNNLNIDGGKF